MSFTAMSTMGYSGAHEYRSQPSPHPWSRTPRQEEQRCTLPSISNLLNLADGHTSSRPTERSRLSLAVPEHHASYTSSPSSRTYHDTPRSGSESGWSPTSHSGSLPPTPPLSSAASADGHSPTDKHIHHFSPINRASGYFQETTPPLDSDARQHSRPSTSPQAGSAYNHDSHHPSSPPRLAPAPTTQDAAYGSNLWQHHHYLNPVHGAGYQQVPERYICNICNKAFSRPSSLRIHSHSHTGEKPFKCAHVGCGKAFSVRSNMKRHERGCHTFDVPANARYPL